MNEKFGVNEMGPNYLILFNALFVDRVFRYTQRVFHRRIFLFIERTKLFYNNKNGVYDEFA